MSEDRKNVLEEIEFVRDSLKSSLEHNLLLLRRFQEENGNCLLPPNKVEGFHLGVWVVTQCHCYKNNRLSEDRKKLLDEMGFMWDPLHSSWELNFLFLRRFR